MYCGRFVFFFCDYGQLHKCEMNGLRGRSAGKSENSARGELTFGTVDGRHSQPSWSGVQRRFGIIRLHSCLKYMENK